jgi:hypothetical protein
MGSLRINRDPNNIKNGTITANLDEAYENPDA